MNDARTLSDEEKASLKQVLNREENTIVLMYGEGTDRQISFYAEGTRLEARLSYPDAQ